MAVQYREDTAGTSGETNFSGVHKEAVQPRLRCSSLGEPISNRYSKNFVQAGPRAPAHEVVTRTLKYTTKYKKLIKIKGIKKAQGCLAELMG